MISTLGRVFTLLVAMSSAAFMAFAISRWATIPDWTSEARELEEYRLTRTEGETPSWTAVTRRTEESVGTSPYIVEVLEKMYKRSTQEAQEKYRDASEDIPLLEEDIQIAQTTIAEDKQAIQNRVQELVGRLDQMNQEVERLTAAAEMQKVEAQKLQLERERRKTDVFRLNEELAEVRNDIFRADQLQNRLNDMIYRLQGSVVKLQTRQQQLKESLQ